jgi:hypothetical protein
MGGACSMYGGRDKRGQSVAEDTQNKEIALKT